MDSRPPSPSPSSSLPPAPPKRRRWPVKLALWCVGAIAAGCTGAALLVLYALVVASPRLPAIDALTDYRPKVPLRIYTADHVLIGEFGNERRDVRLLMGLSALCGAGTAAALVWN